jgi:hypothetical protein
MINNSLLNDSATKEALKNSSVVMVESLPSPSSGLSWMWHAQTIRLVLVAHGTLIAPPNGWKLLRRKISHSQVGGVTNAFGKIGIYFRDKGGEVEAALELVSCAKYPRRDLRSILKIAVDGHRCGPPSESLATTSATGQVAKHVRPGVVMSSGLLDVKVSGNCLRLSRVKTLFGGNMWVIRPLTTPEVLSCWDIPEKLGVLGGTDDNLKSILRDLTTPMKIRM